MLINTNKLVFLILNILPTLVSMFKYTYTILLIFILQSAATKANNTVLVKSDFVYKELGREIEYVTTAKGELSIQNFLDNRHTIFIQNNHDMLLLNEDEYKEDLWLHFIIQSNSNKEQDLILNLNNSLINWVEYYEVSEHKIIKHNISGDALPVSNKFIREKNPIYPIHLNANQTLHVYFKFNLGGRKIHAPMELHSYNHFIEYNLKQDLELGFFYGILVCLSFICFIMFYLLRDLVYFYLASYFTSQLFLQVSISGIGYVLLWPNLPFWNDRSVSFFMALSIFLAIVFLVEFINKKNIHKYSYYLILFIQFISFVLLFTSFGEGQIYNVSVWILYKLIPVFYIGFFILSSYFFLTKFLPARYFFSAFLMSLLSIGAIYYYALTRTHNNIFTNQVLIIGEILKSLLLMLASLDRLRIFKEEKELAQMQVIQQLEQLNTLKENANLDLMKKVEEKTLELSLKQNEVKKALIWGEEQERKRVAQELHDGMGSLLSTLRLNAESIDLNDKGLSDKEFYAYQNVIELIDKACTELRNISHNMMPTGLDQFGLVQQLISIVKKINASETVKVSLDTFGMEVRLNKDIELSIYRICLELMNNIIKHSKAKNATIQLIRNSNNLSIIIEDDGHGFDINNITHGLGLTSIHSRVDAFNGSITIDSNNNRGTTCIIELPLE